MNDIRLSDSGIDISNAGTWSTQGTEKVSSRVKQASNMKSLKQAEMQGEYVTISDQQVVKALERAIQAMQGASTSLRFSVHEKTKQIMVQVKNEETGEIIRELPPEKTLDFLAKVWEMAGLFIDERR